MKTPKPNFHPSTPKRLLREAKKADYKFHRLAANLGINSGHIHKLMKQGIEPKDPAIRVKLFLSKHPRKPPKPKAVPLPPAMLWWRRQSKEFRRTVIQIEYDKQGEHHAN